MRKAFIPELCVREFGRAAFRVDDLTAWLKLRGYTLPATARPIDDFDFVHVETLLAGIQGAVQSEAESFKPRTSIELARDLPCPPQLQPFMDEGCEPISNFLQGANAAVQWRELFTDAIAAGELKPVDAMTGLPLVSYKANPQEAGPTPSIAHSQGEVETWKRQARDLALEIIKRQRGRDLFPSQMAIADEIAINFRKGGIVGTDGKPLTGSYIKRHALAGITSAVGKQLSTSLGQGKRGK